MTEGAADDQTPEELIEGLRAFVGDESRNLADLESTIEMLRALAVTEPFDEQGIWNRVQTTLWGDDAQEDGK